MLDWPQLELERVNSFLTSRLEEIKNTIKDSIRASFSMYDLNLDVNDFPKKAATLEGNHLLSHLNGSSDLQQIDLDLAPLSLESFKNHLDLANGWEDPNRTVSPASSTTTATPPPTATKDILRLNATPTLSKFVSVRSPERCSSVVLDEATVKSKEDVSDSKSMVQSAPKSKKNKKQQQKQEASVSEQNSNKPTKTAPSNETLKTNDCKETMPNWSKPGGRPPQHCLENLRNGKEPRKAEECRATKHHANGVVVNMQRVRGDAETRGRAEQEVENKTNYAVAAIGQQQQNQQQSKGKNKKNKNKGEKSNIIGNLSLTPVIHY